MMLLTAGTRGDVEPFTALARHAADAGHEVRLGLVDGSGADAAGLDAVSLEMPASAVVPDLTGGPMAVLRRVRGEVRPSLRRMLAAAVRETVAFRPDVVVHHPLVLSAPMVADALAVPRVLVEFSPVATPSVELPAAGGPTALRDLGRANRWTYAVPRAAARLLRADVAAAAEQLPAGRSPGARTRSRATLMAISPQLLPRPSDWPSRVHLTGAWSDERTDHVLDPSVAAFLRGAVLVASFGSMAAGDPVLRAEAVVAAARAHGLRVLLLTGWGGLQPRHDLLGPDVLAMRSAPLGPVLQGASVVVHHGGAGTAHAAARAGVPSVVVPFIADQPFWAHRLHRVGIAAAPVPFRRVTADALRVAVGEALRQGPRAAAVGRAVRAEHGVQHAVEVLEAVRADDVRR